MNYALADLHGNGTIYQGIKAFLKPDDKVYFLGDAIDRGSDGWEILKNMIIDKRFTCLLGNHEQMMLNATSESGYEDYEALDLWMYNGGYPTYLAMKDDDEVTVHQIRQAVRKFPLYGVYSRALDDNNTKIFLSHSGWGLHHPVEESKDFADLYLWDRKHFLTTDMQIPANRYVIHGHTPIDYMKTKVKDPVIDKMALYYNNGHKIDIDCGTINTHETVLLDLDTFEEHIFKEVD